MITLNQETKWKDIYNWATAITFLRFILTVYCSYLILANNFIAALVVLAIAALTDFFDGWTARKLNCSSVFGQRLDPLADKCMLVLIFFFSPIVASLIFIMEIIAREFAAIIRQQKNRHFIAPGSKFITGFQMTLLGCLILNNLMSPSNEIKFIETIILITLLWLSYKRLTIYKRGYLEIKQSLSEDNNFHTPANYITVFGLILIPVIIWLYTAGKTDLALLLYGFAWLTDLFDGLVAKKLNQKTIVGARLDPIRDKALIMLAVIICWPELWFIVYLIILETISAIFFNQRQKLVKLPPTESIIQSSRIATVIQGFFLICALEIKNNVSYDDLMTVGRVVLMASGFRTFTYFIAYLQALMLKKKEEMIRRQNEIKSLFE